LFQKIVNGKPKATERMAHACGLPFNPDYSTLLVDRHHYSSHYDFVAKEKNSTLSLLRMPKVAGIVLNSGADSFFCVLQELRTIPANLLADRSGVQRIV
jgi:hypothetical protein